MGGSISLISARVVNFVKVITNITEELNEPLSIRRFHVFTNSIHCDFNGYILGMNLYGVTNYTLQCEECNRCIVGTTNKLIIRAVNHKQQTCRYKKVLT